MTNASSRLPRSFQVSLASRSGRAAYSARPPGENGTNVASTMANASAARSRPDQRAENRGRPVRLQRHHPISCRKGNAQSAHDQAWPAEPLRSTHEGGIPRSITLRRPAIEKERQPEPKREVNGRARQEERHV